MAYGEPGTPRGAFLPINANHSDKSNCSISITCYRNQIKSTNCLLAIPNKMKMQSYVTLPQRWSQFHEVSKINQIEKNINK